MQADNTFRLVDDILSGWVDMTRVRGESLRALSHSLTTVNITYPTPNETNLTTPLNLPTSDPGVGAPQITYTVQASDFPTMDINIPTKWCYTFVIAGQNPTVYLTYTQSSALYKNGTLVANASASTVGTANAYWTRTCFGYDISVGDVLTCRIWASNSSLTYSYWALAIYPTRLGAVNTIYEDIVIKTGPASYPTLTKGTTPTKSGSGALTMYPCNIPTNPTLSSANATYTASVPHATYDGSGNSWGLYRTANGDTTTNQWASIAVNASQKPRYSAQWVPSSVTFRAIDLKL